MEFFLVGAILLYCIVSHLIFLRSHFLMQYIFEGDFGIFSTFHFQLLLDSLVSRIRLRAVLRRGGAENPQVLFSDMHLFWEKIGQFQKSFRTRSPKGELCLHQGERSFEVSLVHSGLHIGRTVSLDRDGYASSRRASNSVFELQPSQCSHRAWSNEIGRHLHGLHILPLEFDLAYA